MINRSLKLRKHYKLIGKQHRITLMSLAYLRREEMIQSLLKVYLSLVQSDGYRDDETLEGVIKTGCLVHIGRPCFKPFK